MFVKDIIQEYSVRNRENHAYPVYSVTNSQGFCKDYFGKEVASKDKSTYKIVPYGYFAYNPSRINVGSIDWQHCEDYVIVSPLYNVFKVNTNLVSQDYLSYYFKSSLVSTYINALAKGTVRLNIPLSVLGNFPIPVPPIAEQERIVAELDLLQGIIEKKKEQLKAYDQLAQSIFHTMFGDPIDNPKGWEVKKLKDVTTKIGSGATPKGGNQSYKNEGISLIRSLNVHNGSFKYEDLAHIDEQQAHQLNNVIVEENDVLFNITGASVARCCIVPFDVLPARVNQHVSILRPKKEIVNHVYLCYYLISPNSQNALLVMSKSNAATREALPKSMMEKYSICVPPLSLQQEFAEKVEAIERQKALVQQSIEETQTMFDCTMDKYFG